MGSRSDLLAAASRAAITGAGVAVLLALCLPTPAYADEAASMTALEEVVVTARKREESLQQVPLSVAAVSAEQLEARSIDNLADLGQSTPNFSFNETPNAGRLGGLAFIRGVGQRDALASFDPAVGIYVDGVYMGRMFANNVEAMDLQRVEVLRGPQGTLFGKNTSGGAISMVTQRPDPSADGPSGRVAVTAGSRERFDLSGAVNLPLVSDRLALRVSAARRSQDGYGRRGDGQEMNDIDRVSARAQLLFQPTETFTALLSADYFNSDERNASYKLVDVNTTLGTVIAVNTLTPLRYDDRWLSPSDFVYFATGPNAADSEVWGGSLTLSYEADDVTLKSITAYRGSDTGNYVDPDGSPVVILNLFNETNQHQVSQEFQATGSSFDGRLEWVVGAYYFNEIVSDTFRYNLLFDVFRGARDFHSFADTENTSKAVYGQGSYKLTDELRITAGLRYTDDKKSVDLQRFGFNPFRTGGVFKSDAISPRLGLDYQWTPRVMTYVSVAQGAKNGGRGARAGTPADFVTFKDETVWTYEAGVRSDLFGGRVRFNGTIFYSDYKDLQLQINGSTIVGGAPAPFSVVTNIPEASIKGGEFELAVAATDNLILSAALGVTDAQYEELPTDNRFIASRAINKDTRFSNVPKVAYTLAADYSRPISETVELKARVDYSHKSKIYYGAENTVNQLQPAYGLLNGRLTLEHAPSGVSISVFATNLTDEHFIVGAFDDSAKPNPGLGFAIVNLGPPREWGVTLQKRF